jgi:serine/threonine protein kinase
VNVRTQAADPGIPGALCLLLRFTNGVGDYDRTSLMGEIKRMSSFTRSADEGQQGAEWAAPHVRAGLDLARDPQRPLHVPPLKRAPQGGWREPPVIEAEPIEPHSRYLRAATGRGFVVGPSCASGTHGLIRLVVMRDADAAITRVYVGKELAPDTVGGVSVPPTPVSTPKPREKGPSLFRGVQASEAMQRGGTPTLLKSSAEALDREVRLLSKVKSPMEVQARINVSNPPRTILVGPLVDCDLHAVWTQIAARPVAAKQAFVLKVLRGLLEELSAVHAQNLAHLDLKPGNVLVERDGTTYLADFGNADSANPALAPERRLGTYGFLAPEALDSLVYDRQKVDVWGAAAIAMGLLTNTGVLWKAFYPAKAEGIRYLNAIVRRCDLDDAVKQFAHSKGGVEVLQRFRKAFGRESAAALRNLSDPKEIIAVLYQLLKQTKAGRQFLEDIKGAHAEAATKQQYQEYLQMKADYAQAFAAARQGTGVGQLSEEARDMYDRLQKLKKAYPALYDLLSNMMHPEPSERPSVQAAISWLEDRQLTVSATQESDVHKLLANLDRPMRDHADKLGRELEAVAQAYEKPALRRSKSTSDLPRVELPRPTEKERRGPRRNAP